MDNWIDYLLTENKTDKLLEFTELESKSKGKVFAIMEYRQLEIEKGRGQEFKDNVTDGNIIEVLEELFIEPVDHLKQMLHKKMVSLEIDIKEMYTLLYNQHLENKGLRFLTVLRSL